MSLLQYHYSTNVYTACTSIFDVWVECVVCVVAAQVFRLNRLQVFPVRQDYMYASSYMYVQIWFK